jgi:hypothetical protein
MEKLHTPVYRLIQRVNIRRGGRGRKKERRNIILFQLDLVTA